MENITEERLVVSRWETILMLVNIFCLKAFTAYPGFLNTVTGTGGWLAAIFGSVAAFFVTWLITALYRKHSDCSYPEIMSRRFGGWLSGGVVIFAVVSLVTTLSFFVDFIAGSLSVTHFPMTPKWLLCLILLLPAMHGAYKGIGTSIRISAPVGIITIVLFAVTFTSVMLSSSSIELFPIFGTSYPDFIKGVLFGMTLFSDFFLLLFMMSNIEERKGMMGIWSKTIIISALVFVLTVIMVQASFMPEGYESVSAIDRVESYVKTGRYYARTERMFTIIWLMSYLCSFCVYFSYIAELTHSLTGLKKSPIIIITGAVVYVITLGSPSLSHIMVLMSFGWMALPLLTAFKGREGSI